MSYGVHSRFVLECLERLGKREGLALDIPCGRGRHSVLLVLYGYEVVSADLDMAALTAIAQDGVVGLLKLDATKYLPFREAVFDLVLVIHPHALSVLPPVFACIKEGGHLIFETFGGQGGNWLDLPHKRQIADALCDGFHMVRYIERPLRQHPDRVAVKALFQKRSPPLR